MRVLLIGSGGREHAIALALSIDPDVSEIIAAPGNPGIGMLAELRQVDILDAGAVARLAKAEGADLVVIGPEAPLVQGVADAVRKVGVACFGPSAAAARLEGSKEFAKQVMGQAEVQTARFYACSTDAEYRAALDAFEPPYVVKNDGLAAGKGVVVTSDYAKALAHAQACGKVVIEEYLDGPEVSLFVVTDGVAAVPLLPAQDFKRVGDGDTGPNTGGMGAYAPVPWLPPGFTEDVMASVVRPTLQRMRELDTPFQGLLYVGLAVTKRGPKVVEFNCRLGDPDGPPVLALLRTPLGGLLYAAATGKLAHHPALRWHPGAAVTVVLATSGYPGIPQTGGEIIGAAAAGLLHAGTALDAGGTLRAAGGRVLSATAAGEDLTEARANAYALIRAVKLEGAHYRTDIALAAAEGRIRLP